MPSAIDGPTVTLSFANNFWGKDDAGVGPLLDRMASAKQTSDELRSFYSARASLEDDYARKLLSLSKKPLGSHEMGSLRASLDTLRGEVESMAKQHASIAAQMKTELEEPLAAFAGGMKERRKIIQNTVEKILKVKIQQTHAVNKTRDRYEQDCLRIKGYLAQGHMVMGQEERKNKAKLEKTQISLASSNAEYESAVKALEDTTARWNREWKAAADKFQDLEEERLDFSKSSLWTFANLASTVCVSDDASCEKIRLSLEKMDVENDIMHFISEKGTGQEIPDPPKYINFCRGDVDDHRSEVSEEENYSVAQFPRSINPAFRTSSPQPSTYESHHDPNSALARDLGHQEPPSPLHIEHNMNVPRPQTQGHPNPGPGGPPQQNIHPPPTGVPPNSHHLALAHQNSRPLGMPRHNGHPHVHPDQIIPPSSMTHHATRHHGPPPTSPYHHGHPPPNTYQNSPSSTVAHQNSHSPAAAAAHQNGRSSSYIHQQDTYPPATSHYNGPSPAVTHRNSLPPAIAPEDQHPPAITRQDNYPPALTHQNTLPPAITHENHHHSTTPQQKSVPLAITREDRHSSAATPQDSHSPATSHRNSLPPAVGHEDNLPSAVTHEENQLPTTIERNGLPAASAHQDSHPPASAHQKSDPPIAARQDAYPIQERRAVQAPQQYDASQFSAVPHDPYPMDGMTMLCRTDGANSAAGQKVSSRSDGLKSSTKTPSVSSRIEALNATKSPDAPARYEVARQKTNSSVAPRLEMIKSPVRTANVPPRIEAFTSTTSSSVTARHEPNNSATSSNISAPDDNSDYSNPTSLSSQEPPSGKTSPVKAEPAVVEPEKRMVKKKSGFFQNHSPFRRKSTKEVSKDSRPANRNTWAPAATPSTTTPRRAPTYQPEPKTATKDRTASPEPIDANASLALNVGQNVFPVANTDKRNQSPDKGAQAPAEEQDPIALALAELKGAADNKRSASRISADRYHGISTPVPERRHERTQSQTQEQPRDQTRDRPVDRFVAQPVERAAERAAERPAAERTQERTQDRTPLFTRPVPAPRAGTDAGVAARGTPPPSYDTPVQRLGVPPPAVTSKAMQESSRKYTAQTRQMLSSSRPASVYNSAPSRPATRQADVPRAASPAPPRSVSPRPGTRAEARPETRPGTRAETRVEVRAEARPETRQAQRSVSPNPYGGSQHGGSPRPSFSSRRDSGQGYYQPNSPAGVQSRTASPSPYRADYERPMSRGSAMAIQLAPVGGEGSIYGSVRSRGSGARPGTSSSSRAMSLYDGRDSGGQDTRQRSRSVADPSRQYTPEGRAILHYARALYTYQAAIPEELGFAKGDILAVLRHQDDGWWDAEIHSGNGVGQGGLVPSNYLQPC